MDARAEGCFSGEHRRARSQTWLPDVEAAGRGATSLLFRGRINCCLLLLRDVFLD